MNTIFLYDQYLLKKQVIALTGKLRFYNPQGQMVMFCQQKLFKLKEDIRLYTDELKNQELLNIQARQILDFSAYYDVYDSQYSTKVGGLRRKGFRSMIQDEWEIFNDQDTSIGLLREDSLTYSLLRRFLVGSLLPQNYDLLISNESCVDLKQRFNPFRYDLDIIFLPGKDSKIDRRLVIAAAVLIATIEGRQQK